MLLPSQGWFCPRRRTQSCPLFSGSPGELAATPRPKPRRSRRLRQPQAEQSPGSNSLLPSSTACEGQNEMRERKHAIALESSPPNIRKGEFRGAPQGPLDQCFRNRVLFATRDLDTRTQEDEALATLSRVSLAFARIGFHFDRYYGLVVECIDAGGVRSYRLENLPHYAFRGFRRAICNDRGNALRAKRMTIAIAGVKDAVAMEHEHVARFRLKTEFIVIRFVKEPQRQSRRLDKFNFAGMTIDRPRQAGIRH